MTPEIIDLSHPIDEATPVYPGDPGVAIEILDISKEPIGDLPRGLNNSRLSIGLHNGTHLDAPFHFFSGRCTVESLPIEKCCGAAIWIDLSSTEERGLVDAPDLAKFERTIVDHQKLLISTGWDSHWNSAHYFTEHPVLTRDAARFIVDKGIELVGVDFPSVDRSPFEAHLELLGNDVLIVENLTNISALGLGDFDLFTVPLKIMGRDASPVRAFAIKRNNKGSNCG